MVDQFSWIEGLNRSSPRQTTVEYVRETLRSAILGGELAPGTRLVQAELATALETSTTPVREALRDLTNEGLIRFDPHRGAVVKTPDPEELDEIYQICRLLEPSAIKHALERVDDDLIFRLQKLHKRMLDERNAPEWVDLNRTFHMSIYEASMKPRLSAIIQNLRDASVMYIGATLIREPQLLAEANSDHGDIIRALEQRDAEAAVEVTLRHLTLSMRVLAHHQEESAP